ncbi:MAG: ATP synthase F1 subunit epsilon [Sedimentisphaerales bacterium]|nr:ATP synthase F1 subunit epsilon [Sedimentisphaerales bacterium]
MVGFASAVFQVQLLTPQGKLLDCRAGSLILPGHDGQVGILRNHAPILVKLGMGLMRVEQIRDRTNAYFVVNGGFARVNNNQAAVLAFDVITFEGMEKQEADKMLQRARSVVYGGGYIRQMEEMDVRKAALIVRMADYAAMGGLPE